MTKKIFILLCAVFVSLTACSKEDIPIQVSELPQTAQQFIKTYFSNQEVAYALKDNDSFEVAFASGYKVDFDKKGNWKEVDCKFDAIPAGIAPTSITDYVSRNFPTSFIVKIERDKKEYEVELNSGLDLKFDANGNFKKVD